MSAGFWDPRAWWMGAALHLWQASLVILLLWAIDRRLLRQAPARWQGGLWWLALLELCVPASVGAALIERALAWWPGAEEVRGSVAAVGLRSVLHPELLSLPEPQAGVAAWPWQVLTLAWMAGVVVMTVLLLRHVRGEATAPVPPEARWQRRLAVAARRARVDPVRIAVVDGTTMPHAIGLWRQRIVLPGSLIGALPADELAAVLAHEAAHCRRRDGLRRALLLPVLVVLWFFPPAWLVLRRVHGAAELACDEAVVRAGFAPRVYARALARTVRLGLAWPVSVPALAIGHGAELQTRLRHIRRAGKEIDMMRLLAAVCLAGTIVAGSLAAAVPEALGQRARPGLEAAKAEFPALGRLRGVERAVDVDLEGELAAILRTIAEIGGFEVDTSKLLLAFRRDNAVRLQARNGTVGESLAVLARSEGLAYEVPVPRRLVVTSIQGPRPVGLVRSMTDTAPRRDAAGRLQVGGEIQAPERIVYVVPEYPELARRARLSGIVILEATIDREGNVANATVLRGLGLGLDEAARAALLQWKYTPTFYNDKPVEVLLTVTVLFELGAAK